MKQEPDVEFHPARVAIRLLALMAYFKKSKSAFARSIRRSPGAVGNWLSAKHNPDYEAVQQMMRVYNISSDWLYYGRVQTLPEELREPLSSLEDRIRISGSKGTPKK